MARTPRQPDHERTAHGVTVRLYSITDGGFVGRVAGLPGEYSVVRDRRHPGAYHLTYQQQGEHTRDLGRVAGGIGGVGGSVGVLGVLAIDASNRLGRLFPGGRRNGARPPQYKLAPTKAAYGTGYLMLFPVSRPRMRRAFGGGDPTVLAWEEGSAGWRSHWTFTGPGGPFTVGFRGPRYSGSQWQQVGIIGGNGPEKLGTFLIWLQDQLAAPPHCRGKRQ